jgi:hypothetical protein
VSRVLRLAMGIIQEEIIASARDVLFSYICTGIIIRLIYEIKI